MNTIRVSRLAFTRTARSSVLPTSVSQYPHCYAHSSYGGGEGNPKGEAPQKQGPSQSEHLEHPGPPPPSTGSGNKNTNTSSNDSKGSNQGPSGEEDSEHRGPKKGASPKILDTAPPTNPSEDVEKHNREFENRHDRTTNKINPDGKQNVGKGSGSGQGDADRQP
ncbi:MAG: hypothetical protein MMC23_001828 [Stictis urceolatum]|nr:hypothetical protein [Stictis urceolata]